MIKVLLIEDNEDHVHFIESSLDKKRFELTTLTDGKQALDYLLRSGEVQDVVLLDYYLPIMDGLQVLKKTQEAGKDFALIFLTVDTSVETAVEAMKSGALDFMPKTERFYDGLSVMIEKVHRIHKTHLEKKQIEEGLRESEEKYRQLFQTELDSIMIFNSETKQYIDVNKSCEILYGYTKEEFLKLKVTDIPNEPEETKDSIKKTLAGKLNRIPIRYHKKKDGTVFPVEISASTFKLDGRQVVCGVVRDITERKKAEEALRKSESELRKQKLALEQKTVALREVIGQIELEKNEIKSDIAANIIEVILPIMGKILLKDPSNDYIDLLRHYLENLASSFGRKITHISPKLTPREIEICTMIENGFINKEISSLLNISCPTVEQHRKNIRRKLDISNKNINLVSFLQQLSS